VALIGFSKYSLLANFLRKKVVIILHVTPIWSISLTISAMPCHAALSLPAVWRPSSLHVHSLDFCCACEVN